jgi:hypothetical protein
MQRFSSNFYFWPFISHKDSVLALARPEGDLKT